MALGDRWLSLADAAVLAGVPIWTLRRRVKAIDRQNPGLGLLRRPGKREYLVSAEALQRALTTDPGLETVRDHLQSELQHHGDRMTALVKATRTLRAELRAAVSRIEALERERVTLPRARVTRHGRVTHA